MSIRPSRPGLSSNFLAKMKIGNSKRTVMPTVVPHRVVEPYNMEGVDRNRDREIERERERAKKAW